MKVALETPAPPYPAFFSLLDVDLWDPPAPKKMKRGRSPSLSSSSSTSAGGKGAVLKKRAKSRTRKLVNMTMEDGDLTLLERSAIGDRSHKAYKAELEEFKAFARDVNLGSNPLWISQGGPSSDSALGLRLFSVLPGFQDSNHHLGSGSDSISNSTFRTFNRQSKESQNPTRSPKERTMEIPAQ